ncbi:expressed unknown protein [Seminavis robusta]|uniref:Uncharacterized protein n=1 Tax=Seminavis robusta TaxID=568900 RepID=A0A9N8F0V6_9STRA|nr:expressed unknown protein [Seminavis robusta]|eukprot:Sro2263_g321240.1 n/a (578) ;mRNA; f:8427-10160
MGCCQSGQSLQEQVRADMLRARETRAARLRPSNDEVAGWDNAIQQYHQEGPPSLPWDEIHDAFPYLLSAHALFHGARDWSRPRVCQKIDEHFFCTDEPSIILFISHTWENRHYPDPSGRQWQALQHLLSMIVDLADTLQDLFSPSSSSANIRELTARIPLLVEGVLPVVSLLLSMPGEDIPDSDTVLSKIAIFFDYMCLPQNSEVDNVQRDEAQEQVFRRGLQKMHMLCTLSSVVALRFDSDDFSKSAWCISEMYVPTTSFGAFSYEVFPENYGSPARWYTALDSGTLQQAAGVPANIKSRVELLASQFHLATTSEDAVTIVHALIVCASPFFTATLHFQQLQSALDVASRVGNLDAFKPKMLCGNEPDIMYTQSASNMGTVRTRTEKALLYELNNLGRDQVILVDLGRMLSNIMIFHGMVCKSKADLTYVALSAFQTQEGLFQGFFYDCLQAWLGRTERRKEFPVVLKPLAFQSENDNFFTFISPIQFEQLTSGPVMHPELMVYVNRFRKVFSYCLPLSSSMETGVLDSQWGDSPRLRHLALDGSPDTDLLMDHFSEQPPSCPSKVIQMYELSQSF